MLSELKDRAESIQQTLLNSEIVFDYAAKTESIKEIETQMSATGF